MKCLKFCLFLLLIPSAFAISVSHLYEANVPVADQSDTARNVAMQQGLQAVVLKLTAEQRVLQQIDIQRALQSPNAYVLQYTYLRNTDAATQVASPWILQVNYQRNLVNQLFQSAQVMTWPADRPAVLFWIVYDDGQQQQWLSNNLPNPILLPLQEVATTRALPLLMPKLDLLDTNNMTFADVVNLALDNIYTASERYRPNAIVLLQVQQTPDHAWKMQWTLLIDHQPNQWNNTGSDPVALTEQGMNQVVDTLAQHYRIVPSSNQPPITLTVQGINTLQDLAKTEAYLQQLSPVAQVEIAQLNATQVQFRLRLRGDLTSFQNALKLDQQLQLTDADSGSLVYHLVG